jgi:hypothetical protein
MIMSNTNPTYLDLDAIAEGAELVVKLKGKEHKLKQASVADFIANTKQLQKLQGKMTIEEEFDQLIEMILRCFPTMKRDDIDGMTVPQMNRLVATAFEMNGQQEAGEALKTEGNEPQTDLAT